MTTFQANVQRVIELAAQKGMTVSEQDAARIVRAGARLAKQKAERSGK